jgi:hypothetical protein
MKGATRAWDSVYEDWHGCGIPLNAELIDRCLLCLFSAGLSNSTLLSHRVCLPDIVAGKVKMSMMEVGCDSMTSTRWIMSESR